MHETFGEQWCGRCTPVLTTEQRKLRTFRIFGHGYWARHEFLGRVLYGVFSDLTWTLIGAGTGLIPLGLGSLVADNIAKGSKIYK